MTNIIPHLQSQPLEAFYQQARSNPLFCLLKEEGIFNSGHGRDFEKHMIESSKLFEKSMELLKSKGFKLKQDSDIAFEVRSKHIIPKPLFNMPYEEYDLKTVAITIDYCCFSFNFKITAKDDLYYPAFFAEVRIEDKGLFFVLSNTQIQTTQTLEFSDYQNSLVAFINQLDSQYSF